jgi:multimeric flavodoxin WrbA
LCKMDDGLKNIYPLLLSAEAIVLGTPTYHASMNGFMTVFLERLWPFRHQRFPLEGKPFAVVSAGAGIGASGTAIDAVKLRMTAYRAKFVGSVWFASNIFPCFKCGYGLTCNVGSFYKTHGKEGQKSLKITEKLYSRWEDIPGLTAKINELVNQLIVHLGGGFRSTLD